MHILVTRPEPDGLKLKGMLEARGHAATVEPLLTVSFDDCAAVELDGVTALIATSRNALRGLRGSLTQAQARDLRIYAVGTATAEEARRLGFGTIIKGPGTAAGLIPVITSTLDPAEEMLLHLRGEQVAIDMAGELEAQGFRVAEAIVYRMRAAQAFSDIVRELISERDIEAVMLMSPQTASIYAKLVQKARLQLPARLITHLCLSDAVAARLAALGKVPIEVAETPSLEEMLALADLAAAKLE